MIGTMYLDDAKLRPDNNNLTLVRLVLASAVIFTHCFYWATGDADHDPLDWLFGAKISHLAVDGFFFLSGFLVYRSLLRKNDIVSFAKARFLRIWPGLAAFVLATLLIGYYFSAPPPPTHIFRE